jgi:hypothetical protein
MNSYLFQFSGGFGTTYAGTDNLLIFLWLEVTVFPKAVQQILSQACSCFQLALHAEIL